MLTTKDILGNIEALRIDSAKRFDEFNKVHRPIINSNNDAIKKFLFEYLHLIKIESLIEKAIEPTNKMVTYYFDHDGWLEGQIEVSEVVKDLPDVILDLMEQYQDEIDYFHYNPEEGSRCFYESYGPSIIVTYTSDNSFVFNQETNQVIIESKDSIYNSLHLSLEIELAMFASGLYPNVIEVDYYGNFLKFSDYYENSTIKILNDEYKLAFNYDESKAQYYLNSNLIKLIKFFRLLPKVDKENIYVHDFYDIFGENHEGNLNLGFVTDVSNLNIEFNQYKESQGIYFKITGKIYHDEYSDDHQEYESGYHDFSFICSLEKDKDYFKLEKK